jgi:hypothetical protein
MVRVQKKARGRTTGTGGSSGLPCAMVLRLIRDLPGDQLGCHRRLAGQVPRDLAPALERQDHAISPSAQNAARRARIAPGDVRPSHPAPNVRDDREPPLFLGCGISESIVLICPTTQCRGPAASWHDGQFAHGVYARLFRPPSFRGARRTVFQLHRQHRDQIVTAARHPRHIISRGFFRWRLSEEVPVRAAPSPWSVIQPLHRLGLAACIREFYWRRLARAKVEDGSSPKASW